jgi:ribosomal protein L17
MRKSILINTLLSVGLLSACSVTQNFTKSSSSYQKLNNDDKALADTLLKKALENEGLYTISARLKPMSTVADLTFTLAQKDSLAKGKAQVAEVGSIDYKKLQQYQKVVNALQFGDIGFVLYPFKIQRNGIRNATISIYRQSLVDSMVNANASFYGQFAVTAGVPAPLLIGITEYENSYDRFRSYGNLFGYPLHAVNFFVEAAITNDETKSFVKRDFYNMPVFSRETGRFVYALPKDSKPNQIDEQIKARAAFALAMFKQLRLQYTRKNGTVDYYGLFLKTMAIAK